MRAQVAPRLRVHDALEQAAENGRADAGPVERAGVEQRLARGGVEVGDGQRLFEQPAVDVGEGGQLLVEVRRAPLGRGVEHLEQLREQRAGVAPVGRGALFDEGAKALRGEDGGVVGKQAEQQAHEQHFERVPGAFGRAAKLPVAAGLERVVQAAHALGGLDVDGVLRADFLRLVAGDEAEPAHVLVQIGQRKADFAARVQVDHAKARKVAHHQRVRQVALGNAGEVAHGLVERGLERFATRLLLHQHLPWPEQIDVALPAAVLFDRVLEARDAPVGDAEDLEKVDPERDGLLFFIRSIGPAAAEGHGARLDFVPGQGHGRWGKGRSGSTRIVHEAARRAYAGAGGRLPVISGRNSATTVLSLESAVGS